MREAMDAGMLLITDAAIILLTTSSNNSTIIKGYKSFYHLFAYFIHNAVNAPILPHSVSSQKNFVMVFASFRP